MSMRDVYKRIGEINGDNFSSHRIYIDSWSYGDVIYSDTGVWYHSVRGRDDIDPSGTTSDQRREVFRKLRDWKKELQDVAVKRANSQAVTQQVPIIDGTYVRIQPSGAHYTGD